MERKYLEVNSKLAGHLDSLNKEFTINQFINSKKMIDKFINESIFFNAKQLGNSYTMNELEILVSINVTANKPLEHALSIINLRDTLYYVLDNDPVKFGLGTLETLNDMLRRNMAIGNSDFIRTSKEYLEQVLEEIHKIDCAYSKAMYTYMELKNKSSGSKSDLVLCQLAAMKILVNEGKIPLFVNLENYTTGLDNLQEFSKWTISSYIEMFTKFEKE